MHYEGSERRIYFRILYGIENRSKLSVGECEFEVADISQGGMRLVNTKRITLTLPSSLLSRVSHTLIFLR